MLGIVLESSSKEELLYDRCFEMAYDKLHVPYPVYHMQIATNLDKQISWLRLLSWVLDLAQDWQHLVVLNALRMNRFK